jgi:hypothetical protein
MAINYPGPYEVEYSILVNTFTHKMRMNCVVSGSTPPPGTAPTAINLMTRAGTPATLAVCANGLWEQLRLWYHTSVTCTGYIFWRYPVAGSFVKDFVTAGTLTNQAGLSTTAVNLANQFTESFRTANGGVMKITAFETSFTVLTRNTLTANAAGTAEQKTAAYVISSAGWMIGRDDSFPIAPTYFIGGQNEAVFRKRYRA